MIYAVIVTGIDGASEVIFTAHDHELAYKTARSFNDYSNGFNLVTASVVQYEDYAPGYFDKWDNIVFSCHAVKNSDGAVELRMCDYGVSAREFLDYSHQEDYPHIMRSFADGDIYFKKSFSLKDEFYNLAIVMDEKRSCDVSKEKLDFYKGLALELAERLFEENV